MPPTRLIARDQELDFLGRLAGRAADRIPSAVLVEGEAGIGKTSLVRELVASERTRGRQVLVGACSPGASRDLPFDLWTRVLRGLAPEAGALLGDDGSAASRGQVLASVTDRLLEAARRSGATIVLEDVHWADDSSLDLLDYLIRSARDERLLVAVTVRSPDPAYDAVRERLTELARLPQVHVLRPARLTLDDVRRQLEQLTGSVLDDDSVRRTAERSSGVPFLVEELHAAGDLDGGTVRVGRDLYAHRVTSLSAPARTLVDVAALGRDPLDADLLFEASGLREEEFDSALRESVSSGVLERTGESAYTFRHALLRESTSQEMPPRRRRGLHRRWAEAATRHAGGPGARPADLAEHWAAGGDHARAVVAFVHAADEAARVFAHRERYRMLLGAIAAWDQVPHSGTALDLGARLGEAVELAWTFGDHEKARELIARGRRVYEAPEDRPRQAWFDLYELWLRWGEDRPVPVSEIEQVAFAIRRQPPGRQPARALFTLSNGLLQDGHAAAALPVAEEARAMAFSVPDVTLRAEALGHLAMVLAAVGDAERATGCAAEELALAESVGDPLLVQGALATLGLVRWEAGDVRGARLAAERGRGLLGDSEPGPLARQWAVHTLNSVEGLLDEGLWDEAGRRLDEVAAAAHALSPWAASWGQRLLTWLRVARGEGAPGGLGPRAAGDLEHQRVQDAYAGVTTDVDVFVHLGTHERARATAAAVLWESRIEHAIPAYVWPLLAVTSRAEVEAVVAGDAVDRAVLERLAGLAEVVPVPNPVLEAHATQVASDLAWAGGTPDGALCGEAAAQWERVGMPYWLAWALLRLGRSAAAAGDDHHARACLVRALGIAEELGASPLEQRIRAAATGCGVRLGARSRAGQDAGPLTPREREVLALLGEGATNRGIAERLVISEKTVSVHVSNLLAKLGASNRGEAVAVARRLDLLGGDGR